MCRRVFRLVGSLGGFGPPTYGHPDPTTPRRVDGPKEIFVVRRFVPDRGVPRTEYVTVGITVPRVVVTDGVRRSPLDRPSPDRFLNPVQENPVFPVRPPSSTESTQSLVRSPGRTRRGDRGSHRTLRTSTETRSEWRLIDVLVEYRGPTFPSRSVPRRNSTPLSLGPECRPGCPTPHVPD